MEAEIQEKEVNIKIKDSDITIKGENVTHSIMEKEKPNPEDPINGETEMKLKVVFRAYDKVVTDYFDVNITEERLKKKLNDICWTHIFISKEPVEIPKVIKSNAPKTTIR